MESDGARFFERRHLFWMARAPHRRAGGHFPECIRRNGVGRSLFGYVHLDNEFGRFHTDMSENAAAKPGLAINLQENKQNIAITVVNGTSVSIDAKSVSDLIQLLCKLRCQMEPGSASAQAARPIQMLMDGASQLVIDRVPGDASSIILGVFHPGPGWVGLSLDKKKASGVRDLIEYMAGLVHTH
jgi:hypothetical protein